MKKSLVTGGAGFIGSNLVDELVKKKHEVIIPGMSYISTGLCAALNNNKIIFADIDDDTGLISFESIKKNISKNTKVVIPVNLYGQKVDIKLLRKEPDLFLKKLNHRNANVNLK